ncbi:MAG: glycosyltransferase [Acidobacteriia bacterium]|nr:glycosyltransferase [Terriglobia bacterium]
MRETPGVAGEQGSALGQDHLFRERLRLAFVIDSIQDWNLGGTERQLLRIVNSLDPRRFEPVIFVLQPCPGSSAKDVGCPILLINERPDESRFGAFRHLLRALKRFRPHIVQTFFIDGTFYGTAAAWLARVPAIVQSRRNAGYWQKPHHTFALRVLNHAVDSWQCNSRCVAELLERAEGIPRERIEILHNALDLAHFSPATDSEKLAFRRGLDLPLEAPIFVAVSTLRPVKGLPTVIEAAARLRAHLPQALFVVVGEGLQRDALTKQIEQLGLQGVVRLAGARQDVRPWLAAADIGLLASQSESSSNALMEYMAMGLPAVVSDIPANRELVEGLFFSPGRADELADRMLWLWQHQDARHRMSAAYRAAAAQYGAVAFSEKVQSYYFKLAAGQLRALRHGG